MAQGVFIGVTRNIGEFVYEPSRCSFKHWLSQMVRWRIQDQLDKRLPQQGESLQPSESASEASAPHPSAVPPDLEALWEIEWQRQMLEMAAARVAAKVNAKQYQIFYLHVLKEMPVKEVMLRLDVSRAQVYLAKLRVGRLFRKEWLALRE